MDGISADTKIVHVTPWWSTTLTVAEYTLAVLSLLGAVLLILDMAGISLKKKEKKEKKA